jgi:short-subunit dehydrogenase
MYALITGASSGIGMELAYILANNNYNLILVARREQLLYDLKSDLELTGVEIIVKAFDLGDIKNCFQLFEEVKELKIDLLINNAGFGNIGHFNETNLATELEIVDLNIKAVQILTKLFITFYEDCTIVNISSLAAYLPTPYHASYSASKAYVSSLSRAINYELKKQGKNGRVLTVAPGPVMTNFNRVANASVSRGMDSKKCASIIYRGIKKRKELIIPGFSMKLLYFLNRFIPTKLVMKFAYKIQTRKH